MFEMFFSPLSVQEIGYWNSGRVATSYTSEIVTEDIEDGV